MTTLVVIRYPDQDTAEQARETVTRFEGETINAEQFGVISRDLEGRYHVHTSHSGIPSASRHVSGRSVSGVARRSGGSARPITGWRAR